MDDLHIINEIRLSLEHDTKGKPYGILVKASFTNGSGKSWSRTTVVGLAQLRASSVLKPSDMVLSAVRTIVDEVGNKALLREKVLEGYVTGVLEATNAVDAKG